MASKQQQPAAVTDKPLSLAEQALQHSVYFNASTCEIKGDVVQLAAVWRSGHGPVSKQEAGLLLWYHCHRGEDGQAEVAAAGVINSCLATLNSQDATTADKSIAAGILLTLCQADPKQKEAVVKAKAGPDSCCQVLHACLACGDCMPRHVVALLASLAASPPSLAVLLKALQGEVPWAAYCRLLAGSSKDHATAISTADLVRSLVTGHEVLAAEAAANGLLQALLRCAASHKSAAAVAAAAAALQALCEAAPCNRAQLGELPGSNQQGGAEQQQHDAQMQRTASGRRLPGGSSTGSMRTFGGNPASGILRGSMTPRRTGTGALEDVGALGQSKAARSIKPTKSIRLPDIGEAEGAGAATEARLSDCALNSKSSVARRGGSCTGSDGAGSIAAGRTKAKGFRHLTISCPAGEAPELPQPTQPLLCKNSTALKWQGPVPDATRAAVAGVLSELVQLPQLCRAVHDRLGASRLSALLAAAMKAIAEGGGGKGVKSKKKKKGGSLTLTPENEAYLCNVCVSLKFMTAAENADCYRVAAAGCLPALVQLAAGSKQTRLRQSAKAVLSQAALLAEVHDLVQQAEVPEELLVQVPLKLVDEELKQLLLEFSDHTQRLQRLDDVTARARK
ncbi:hypothetical protein OEZ85_010881 [Tetradesmus obliquus]|uniref:Uncharacterized protein n=1 Tax=Tetradesmus obliquus TaxID=3088 RepID=A0ABY8TNK9_TETOB|nr:hypothetical protein OEZ85_010881 [Tetradesmus obliquus]